MYRDKILCKPCYKTRLIRKKAKKEALKKKAKEIKPKGGAPIAGIEEPIDTKIFDEDAE